MSRRAQTAVLVKVFSCAALLGVSCAPGPDEALDEQQAALASPSRAASLPASFANEWVARMIDITMNERISGAEGSRIIGYFSVAMYEANVARMAGFRSLAGQLNAFTAPSAPASTDGPVAMAEAMERVLRALLVGRSQTSFDSLVALRDQHLAARAAAGVPASVITASRTYGSALADAINAWASADGFVANRNLPYTLPVGPNKWVPTGGAPANARPAEPYFGENRAFALPSNSVCTPPLALAYSEDPASRMYKESQQIRDLSNGITAQQREIATFWADGGGSAGVGGHWMNIARIVMEPTATLERAVHVYTVLGLTEADTFISTWKSKYVHVHFRPETYINRVIDPAWAPAVAAGLFPEYTNGHATTAATGAAVLSLFFGPSKSFTDTTYAGIGLGTRSYSSFAAAAYDSATSRLWIGHHFPSTNVASAAEALCVVGQFFARVRLKQ